MALPGKGQVMRTFAPRTPAEWLWARRRAAGLGIPAAAKALGIGRTTYGLCEQGQHPIPPPRGPMVRPEPTLPVLLALARRRSGMGLVRIAKALRISRVTLLRWEREADPRIIEFWSKKMR